MVRGKGSHTSQWEQLAREKEKFVNAAFKGEVIPACMHSGEP